MTPKKYQQLSPEAKRKVLQDSIDASEKIGIAYTKAMGGIEMKKPKIICLCGSTRFTEQMLIKQWEFTKQGYIVLSWCALPDSYFSGQDTTHVGDQEGVKEIVDEVHKRKIDLADEIFVINIDGYIGESTRSEINYAISQDKQIKSMYVINAEKLK